MTRKPVFRPQADQEVQSARQWYEEQRPGLGIEFASAIDEVVERISSNAFLQPTLQRLALQILHDEIRRALLLTNIVEGANVRVRELGDRAGLTVEARLELRIRRQRRRKNFDRDSAIEPRVAGFVDFAHPAGADGGEDFVRAEPYAGRQRHGSASDRLYGEPDGVRRGFMTRPHGYNADPERDEQ